MSKSSAKVDSVLTLLKLLSNVFVQIQDKANTRTARNYNCLTFFRQQPWKWNGLSFAHSHPRASSINRHHVYSLIIHLNQAMCVPIRLARRDCYRNQLVTPGPPQPRAYYTNAHGGPCWAHLKSRYHFLLCRLQTPVVVVMESLSTADSDDGWRFCGGHRN